MCLPWPRSSPSLPSPDFLPAGDPLDSAALLATGLASLEQFTEVTSTMDRARQLALDPATCLPAAVIADRQTQGRGRQGARWWQAPGSLTVSLVVDATAFGRADGAVPQWSLACGIALAEAIRTCEPRVAAVVRWPNDVEFEGRKLAGILVETGGDGRVTFGIGVNTTGHASQAPAQLRGRVTTLPDITGRPLARQRLLCRFLPTLFGLLAEVAADPARLGDRYRPLCSLTGRRIRIHAADGVHEGDCAGIANDGRLLLETERGRVGFVSGSLTDPADVWRGDE
jgi:BirA family biotin operon repressor/biotin-[acetyl-CoA-carboxylase] ligase